MEIPRQLQHPEFRFLRLRKKGKEPIAEETKWQENNYRFDDIKLKQHLEQDNNYAIIGGYGNLILIDADTKEIEEICEGMIETFTIKTGSPEEYKKHYFFITNRKMKGIRLTEKKVGDLGDVRGVGQYVVAPNSIHPKGGTYKVLKDLPIAKINVEQIKEIFKDYLGAGGSEDFKEYPTITTKRSDEFIRNCRVPDYVINNKLKGNTSKNWELFPYLVDILHNREVTQDVYVALCKRQGHNVGAIKGWVKKAHEGKLMKCSCEKMENYIDKFHPELKEDICGRCEIFLKKKEKENEYSELQLEVLNLLVDKKRDDATEKIVKFIEERYSIYTTKDDSRSEVWIYKEGVYKPEGKSEIKELIRQILGKVYNSNICNRIIEKIEADTFIEQDKFFQINYLYEIPVQNGVLNIITNELSPFNKKKIFFNKLPVTYNPEAECPSIETHFKEVLKREDDKEVLYEVIGFLLYKDYFLEKMLMFVGNGRNGKGKTIDLIRRFIGIDNCASVPLTSIVDNNFRVSELFGKMVNLAGDLSHTSLKDTGMLKQTTGRDLLGVKRKFLKDIKFINYAKHIFACNELPKVYDTSKGFWSRWMMFEFPYEFIEAVEFNKLPEDKRKDKKILDPYHIDKISSDEELSGLLNKALEGLKRILTKKSFSFSQGSDEVKRFWMRKADSFLFFCEENLQASSEGIIPKSRLRKYYHKFCKLHKTKGCSDMAITITLQEMFGVIELRKQEDGLTTKFYEGITFKPNSMFKFQGNKL